MMNTRMFLLLSNFIFISIVIYSFIPPFKSSIIIKPFSPLTPSSTHLFSKADYYNQTRRNTANVIVFLVASYTGDVRHAFDPYPRLLEKIRKLDQSLNDNHTADLIIFHTGYPFRQNILQIFQSTQRQVYFVNIDDVFYRFSPGFNPHLTDPTWSQRGKWNYHHMCYFWFKQVFQLPILRQYRYMMRLDDDSLLLGSWPNIFNILIEHRVVYIANQQEADFDYILPGMTFVRNVTKDFLRQYALQPQNPAMFATIFNRTMEIPNYWNNFEVLDLLWMQRKDVQQFIDAIDRSMGIFLYRWGDAPLRYITLALFTNQNEVLHRKDLKLNYCHPC